MRPKGRQIVNSRVGKTFSLVVEYFVVRMMAAVAGVTRDSQVEVTISVKIGHNVTNRGHPRQPLGIPVQTMKFGDVNIWEIPKPE